MGLIKLYKPIGLTPYDIIKELKQIDKYKETKMSYAGRLDPMAHGVMLILTDKDCYKQELYNNLDKIYQFRLLVGIGTDTNDILGVINSNYTNTDIDSNVIKDSIYKIKGEMEQEYPLFSSKRYNGKPLWYYGKNNMTDKIKVYPSHKIMINDVKITGDELISMKELQNMVNININKLDKNKDFRQDIIIKKWDEIKNIEYKIFNVEVNVSSGTYIRGISKYISKKIGIPTICVDIYRKNILL